MKRIVLLAAVFSIAAYIPTDAERARWTMHDMMSWKTVFQAYYTDHNEYPHVSSVEEARAIAEPDYIKAAPLNDAWGNPYRIESDGKTFRIVSAGADGVFKPETWAAGGRLQSFDDDAVVTNEGRWWLRMWEFKSNDDDRAQKTASEIRVIRTAVEGYAGAHNQWPQAKSMEELRALVQPDFIRKLPMVDEWGAPFVYQLDGNGGYEVRSVNLDRTKKK
ncbi:MAG TPA: type II secretion system protein GspG [Thermoanaerobaculia bacterium]|nr:type II secretion system protein GspG [Thermoanaerobaculia bacterium]